MNGVIGASYWTKFLSIGSFILFISTHCYSQAVFESSGTTSDWDVSTSWTRISGTDGDDIPDADDDVTILNTHTINVNVTVGCNDMTINTGGILQYTNNNRTLTVGGNLVMNGTAVVSTTGNNNNRILNVSGNFSNSASANNTIGGIQVNITGTTTLDGSLTLNHNTGVKTFQGLVDLNTGSSWTSTAITATDRLIFQGGITNDGASFTADDATFNSNPQSLSGSTDLDFNNVTITGITVTNNLASPAEVAVVDLIGTGGFTQGTNAILSIGDDAGITTFSATANPNTVNYTGSTSGNMACGTYHDLNINKTGTAFARFTCNTTINGELTVNSGILRTDDGTAYTINVTGSTSVLAGAPAGEIEIQTNTSTINFQDLTLDGGSVDGGSTTGIVNIATTLTANGTSFIDDCILNVTGATTVNGDFSLSSNNGIKTFQSLVTVNAGGSWTSTSVTNNDRLIFQNGIVNNGTSFTGGDATFNSNAQSLSGSTSISFANDVTVTGITLTNNLVSPDEFTVSLDLQGTGGLTQGTNAILNVGDDIPITTLIANTNPNTVVYNGSAGVVLACPTASTYHHLTIAKTATPNVDFSCSTTINGDLTIYGGNVRSDNNATYTHTVNGSTTIETNTATATYVVRNDLCALNVQDLIMEGGILTGGNASSNVNVATTFNTSGAASTINGLNLTVAGTATLDGPLVLGNNTGVKTFQSLVDINSGGSWASTSITTADRLIFQNGITNDGLSFTAADATFNSNPQSLDGSTELTFDQDVLCTGVIVTNNATATMSDVGTGTLSGTGTWTQGTGTLNYAGETITIGTFNASNTGNTVNYNRAGIQDIFDPSDGSYHNLTTATSGVKTVLANLDVDNDLLISGTSTLEMSTNTADLNLGGSFNNTGGTFNEGTQTMTLDGSGAQTIDNSGGSETFYDIIVDKSAGSVTAGGSLTTLNGQNFTLQTTNAGSFTSPATHNINGNLTIGNGNNGTFTAGTDINIDGNWTNNDATSDFDPNGGTVTFSGTGTQSINGTQATQIFYNVIVNNTGGSVATGGSTTTLNMQDFTMQTTNSGTFTGPTTHNINGNALIGSGNGATWTAATTTNILGDWTNNDAAADFDGNSGTVLFNSSSAAQSIGGSSSTSFYNLTLNNTSGSNPEFTIGAAVTAENNLTMSSGLVDLSSNNLTIGTAAATPGTLVHSSGHLFNGNLVRYYDAATIADGNVAGLFPMGNGTDNRFFYITAPSTAPTTGGTATVSHSNSISATDVSVADDLTIVRRQNSSWAVTTGGGMAGGTYNLRGIGSGLEGIQEVTDLRLMLSGSVVGSPGTNGGTVADPQVNRTGLTFGELTNSFYIGSVDGTNSPLPIELLHFDASFEFNSVRIRWATLSELNNEYFTIERSAGGIEFHEITKIAGAGTTDEQQNYSYIDPNPLPGDSYYRLKQTDYDGQFEIFDAIKVRSSLDDHLLVYPNPVTNGVINVSGLPQSIQQVKLELYSISGIKTFESQFTIEGKNLQLEFPIYISPGYYNLVISTSQGTIRKKIILK